MEDEHPHGGNNQVTGDDQPSSTSDAVSLLSSPMARRTLIYLTDTSTTTVEELADVLTGMEATGADTLATPADRRRVRILLYHCVLPRLDAAGYVDFDAEERTVVRGDVPEVVDELLDLEW